jgi:hypothetical protein
VLSVSGKAAVSIEPGKCSLDDPPTLQQYKAFGCVGLFSDFNRPFPPPVSL